MTMNSTDTMTRAKITTTLTMRMIHTARLRPLLNTGSPTRVTSPGRHGRDRDVGEGSPGVDQRAGGCPWQVPRQQRRSHRQPEVTGPGQDQRAAAGNDP